MKMEWAPRGGTDLCLKLRRSSATSLQVVSCSELAFARREHCKCAGRRRDCVKPWDPFGLPDNTDALTPPFLL